MACRSGFLGQQCGSDSPADLVMLWHGQRFTLELLMESRDHGLVIKYGSGQDYLIAQFSIANDFREVILGD